MLERMKLEGKIRTALRSGTAGNSRVGGDGQNSQRTIDMSHYPPHSAYAAMKGMPGNGMTVQPTYASLEETVPGYMAQRYTPVSTTMAGLGGFGGMPSMPSTYVYVPPKNGMGLPAVNPGVMMTNAPAPAPAPAPTPVVVVNPFNISRFRAAPTGSGHRAMSPARRAFLGGIPSFRGFQSGPATSRATSPARRALYESMGMVPPGLPLASNARGRGSSRGRGASASGRGSKAGSKKRTQRKQRR